MIKINKYKKLDFNKINKILKFILKERIYKTIAELDI